jgi:hypothetical protein
MKNDIDHLKEVSDNLMIQVSLLTAHQKALTSMMLGVWKETLGEEAASYILDTFCQTLEAESKHALDALPANAFFDQSMLLRQKIELLASIQALKNHFQ